MTHKNKMEAMIAALCLFGAIALWYALHPCKTWLGGVQSGPAAEGG